MEACLALRRRPSGVGVKPPGAALAEDRRGERSGKRRARSRQVGTRKTFQKRPIMRSGVRCGSVVSFSDGIEIGGRSRPFEMSLAGVPSTGQAVSGVEAA